MHEPLHPSLGDAGTSAALETALDLARRFAEHLGRTARGGGTGASLSSSLWRTGPGDGTVRRDFRSGASIPPDGTHGSDGPPRTTSALTGGGQGEPDAQGAEGAWPFLPAAPPARPAAASSALVGADARRGADSPEEPTETARRAWDRLDLECKRRTSLSLTEALAALSDRLRREGAS